MSDRKPMDDVIDELRNREECLRIAEENGFNVSLLQGYMVVRCDGVSDDVQVAMKLGVHVATVTSYKERLQKLAVRNIEEFLLLRNYLVGDMLKYGWRKQ